MPSRESRNDSISVMVTTFYDVSGADMMPKAKPSQVIVHRIELQEKEREMIEATLLGARIEGAAKTAVIGVAAAGVGLAGYSAYWALKKMYNWGVEAAQTFEQETVGTLTGEQSVTGGITDAGGFGPFGVPLKVTRQIARLLR